ncbi:hypothetical protein RB6903 [Rhodopirellula baltica SH 1]|uniref:Uncharacterized protein n=1 Tax=Rhodopirellula baltica (strain DSM 10527 / NCIMB 13988 / SH1) TaxID=243090 RepID=Q7UPJ5_RHOBA|nr:hypothetical protein RB6903 [Rhodopirellula baltica SH 1]
MEVAAFHNRFSKAGRWAGWFEAVDGSFDRMTRLGLPGQFFLFGKKQIASDDFI